LITVKERFRGVVDTSVVAPGTAPQRNKTMRPTEILSAEHRVIEQVLDCLEAIADRARNGQSIDLANAEKALRFLKAFADRCHHGKEEDQLFPKMAERGIPARVGPIAVMLDEHEQGRAAIRKMEQALAEARRGDPHGSAGFSEHARAYVDLLREHIAKEDHILFPMAEAALDDADRRAVLAGFERVEEHEVEPGLHEQMLALADDLARCYGVKPAAERHAGVFNGCCHGHALQR
jgi:hemerythrin-like domain-containing protein